MGCQDEAPGSITLDGARTSVAYGTNLYSGTASVWWCAFKCVFSGCLGSFRCAFSGPPPEKTHLKGSQRRISVVGCRA